MRASGIVLGLPLGLPLVFHSISLTERKLSPSEVGVKYKYLEQKRYCFRYIGSLFVNESRARGLFSIPRQGFNRLV